MNQSLKISDSLTLPLDAVTQKLAFLGRTGSGKTYAATKVAEEMLAAGAQVVSLDPVGVHYGLRIAADGKGPGIQIPVFGGLHGDVPIESTGGKLIADLIVDRNLSAVIDVSQFESDAQKARFSADFAERFFFRKKAAPSPVMLFLEEAQEFIPENPQKNEALMLHHWTRLAKLGRNFGIGLSTITQRPQEVNKKVLNLTECMFAFQMTGPHERKTIKSWVEEKGGDLDIVDDLPRFEVGQAHVWSPQWLRVSETIKIGKKWTFNSSSTPAFGSSKRTEPKPLDSADLQRITADMAATIERAKAEDPRELKKEIAALKKQVSGAKTSTSPAVTIKEVSSDKLTAAYERGVKAERKRIRADIGKQLKNALREVSDSTAKIQEQRQKLWDLLQQRPGTEAMTAIEQAISGLDSSVPVDPEEVTVLRFQRHQPPPREIYRTPAPRKAEAVASSNGHVSKAGRKLLTALAQFGTCEDVKLGALTGYSAKAGHFSNVLSELRGNGYIDGERSGFSITNAGMAALGPYEELPTGPELLRYWQQKLSKGAAAILAALADVYPREITDDELGEMVNYSPNAGHFSNCLSELRTRDLIAGGRSALKASDNLF